MDHRGKTYNDWNDVTSVVRNDAVFDNRNKSYGAYWLRRHYNRLAVLAFYIAAGSFTLAITSPLIYHWVKGHGADKEIEKKEVIADLMAPPPVNPDEPPPPPPPPPPVVQQILTQALQKHLLPILLWKAKERERNHLPGFRKCLSFPGAIRSYLNIFRSILIILLLLVKTAYREGLQFVLWWMKTVR
jgi:hypothetical protein